MLLTKPFLALIFFILTFFTIIFTSQYSHLLKSISIDTYEYPNEFHPDIINPILENIKIEDIENDMKKFINDLPSDRYYKSENGYKSSIYIKDYLNSLIENNKSNNDHTYEIELFNHEWKQQSIIFKINNSINYRNNHKTIVIGCHIDSINFKDFNNAPGVDDNLSGIITVIQTIKQIMKLINNNEINLINSLEFHFYSAEEIGSLGSIQLFNSYRSTNKEIIAMLQQDMTGYIGKSIENGFNEHFGIITDYSSKSLMKFTKKIIDNYCDIPYLETKCNKICSDHISALMFGYPSIYVLESKVDLSNPFIHSVKDTIDKINFNHILQHIKLTISFSIELGISNEIKLIKIDQLKDQTSFKFTDFLILLMMHHTKRFIYAVLMFGFTVGSIYVIIDDRKNKLTNESDVAINHLDDDKSNNFKNKGKDKNKTNRKKQ